MSNPPQIPIAVVGVGALFPGSNGPHAFWHDIVNGVDRITDVPATHWLIDDYYDPDPKAPDKTYAKRGGFLNDVPFDALEFGIPPAALTATDTEQLLALIVAKQVLADASELRFGKIDKRRTSVILGVAAMTELATTMNARMQRPIWVKALREIGLPETEVQAACDRIAAAYVPWQENTFPGLLGNVVAGRIANRLDLGGTNAITDAACASSFAALSMGVNELRLNESDLVITGGVDAINDVLIYVCFSKTPALSPSGDCRPFSDAADGTILGEGLGMLALRRLEDAERDGNHIYAVIRGLGASSDGQGMSVYAPSADGQSVALRRAYERAGYTPRTVELLEAHGTGTKAGDLAEFTALRDVFAESSDERQWCALGSIKSQIGHTKAAAGAAGLLKAVMALHHKILPPTIKVERPSSSLPLDESPFYLNCEARPWIASADHPRRASVSSFGFGGSNFHITLEEYTGTAPRPARYRSTLSELVLLSAATMQELVSACSSGPPSGPLQTVARESHARWNAAAPVRLALVVRSLDELRERMHGVVRHLESPERAPLPPDAHLGTGAVHGGLAFLFPGQGSQYPGMGAALAMTFEAARDVWDAEAAAAGAQTPLHRFVFPPHAFDERTRTAQMDALTATDVAQPAITAVSLSLLALLDRLGLAPDAVAGHSSGEVTALGAAGALERADVLALAQRRGALMAAVGGPAGAMGAVSAARETVDAQLRGWNLPVTIANDNSPEQVVISGPRAAVLEALERFTRDGTSTRALPVASAFHSPIIAPSVAPFRAYLDGLPFAAPRIPVYANVTAAPYPAQPASIAELLARQVAEPVRFREIVEQLYERGIRHFVEVGPGSVLTGLVRQSLKGRDFHAITLDRRGAGVDAFWNAIGRLAALGYALDLGALWEDFQIVAPACEPPEHAVMINGTNLGKPYPPAGGTASLPPPNPPRAEPPPRREFVAPDGTASASLAVHRQVAETHAAFQRTMAEAHQQYLQLVAHAMDSLGGTSVAAAPAPKLPSLPQPPPSVVPDAPAVAPQVTVAAPVASSTSFAREIDPASLLMEIVAEKTGYPIAMLRREMELEADLGIDSIKQVEILSAVRERLPNAPTLEPAELAQLRSLDRIIAYLTGGAAQAAPAIEERVEPAATVAEIERRVVQLSVAPLSGKRMRHPRNVELIAGPPDLTREMIAVFAERGAHAREVEEPGPSADAVIYLAGLADADPGAASSMHRSAFLAARAVAARFAADGGLFATVQDTGGCFAVDASCDERAWFGGLPALVKTAALEWPKAEVKAIDVARGKRSDADLARLIVDELLDGGVEREIGLSEDGRRLTLECVVRRTTDSANLPVDASSVLVVSGGGRGVTAAALHALMLRQPCKCVLLGRYELSNEPAELQAATDESSLLRLLAERTNNNGHARTPRELSAEVAKIVAARELRANLAALEKTGARVRYRAVDVRDRAALSAALAETRADWGPITGIIHGAGTLADKRIAEKSIEQFDAVFGTKVEGLAALLGACENDPLRLIAIFSSAAARFGNPGQCDYAMANEVLNRVAHVEAKRHGSGCVVKSICWGPWEGGMVTPSLRKSFESKGVPLIPLDAGAAFFVRELFDGTDVEVVAGTLESSPQPQHPDSPIAAALRRGVASLLHVEPSTVPYDAPLATLGLNSMAVTAMKHEIENELGIDVPLDVLMSSTGIAELAREIERRGQPIVEAPASYGQMSLWYMNELDATGAYHIPAALRIHGPLDVVRLERSLHTLVERHAALRTSFALRNGELVQRIHHERALDFIAQEAPSAIEELTELLAHEAYRRYDLTNDPLFRVRLYRVRDDEHVMMLCAHHIILDLWSFAIVVREVQALYEGTAELSAAESSFVEFTQHERRAVESGELDHELRYWQRQLEGDLPVLDLPADRIRPPATGLSGRGHRFMVSADVATRLKRLAQERGATLFNVLLAAYQLFLHRYTGQDDVITGVSTSGRNSARMASVVGYITNPLPIRTTFAEDVTFVELLDRVNATMLEALAHQRYPFALLVKGLVPDRDPSHAPIFQTMFVLQQCAPETPSSWSALINGAEGARAQAGPLLFEPFPLEPRAAQLDLRWTVVEVADGMSALFEYDAALFEPATIARMAADLCTLLGSIVEQPEKPISTLEIVNPADRRQMLVEWNQSTAVVPNACLHTLFEEQVALTPDAAAVRDGAQSLTYRELNDRAERLAAYLRHRGVGPDVAVGLCLDRSFDMIVGVLGTLKSGGAYVPFDPEQPAQRLQSMIRDAGPLLVLAHASYVELFAESGVEVVTFENISQNSAFPPSLSAVGPPAPSSLAYIIFTSGSTGEPKGVAVEHRSVANFVRYWQTEMPLGNDDRVLQRAPLSFDPSVREIFQPLSAGATVVLAPAAALRDTAALAEVIRDQGITLLQLVASHLDALLDEPAAASCRSLRRVISGGEALALETARRFFATLNATLYNNYGPTEATVEVLSWRCSPEYSGRTVPLGRPIAGAQVYVLDRQLQPVPIGVTGEICIGGMPLARGYVNRPEEQAERFVSHPFSAQEGGRLYRSGDLGYVRPDGNIEIVGRADRQVKVRGNRIELGEIEAVLLRHSGVAAAHAFLREDRPGDRRIVAYVVASSSSNVNPDQLRSYLRALLPEPMVPSDFVVLDALPLTANGKIDIAALQLTAQPSPNGEDTALAPRDALEDELAALWTSILDLPKEKIDVGASFFDSGGDSLLALRLMSAVERRHGRRPPLGAFLQAPTIAGLALYLRAAAVDGAEGIGIADEIPALLHVPSVVRTNGHEPSCTFVLVAASYQTLLSLHMLARLLPQGLAVVTLQPPGNAGVPSAFASIEALAELYLGEIAVAAPAGPYAILGYSVGGLAAYELARQLRVRNKEVSFLGLLDTAFPASLRSSGAIYGAMGNVARATAHLTRRNVLPPWLERWRVDAAAMAQIRAGEQYRPQPYPGNVTFFGSHEFLAPQFVQADRWRKFAGGEWREIAVGGRHDTMLAPPHVEELARHLRAELESALGTAAPLHG